MPAEGLDHLAATKTRSSTCRIPEIGRRMASPTRLNLRKQSSSRLARELHLGMAASDARGPQFGEGPAIHFRLSRVRSLPGPTATGLYFTVLLCMLYSLHDGSARWFREASDWPLRPRRPPQRAALFVPIPVFSALGSPNVSHAVRLLHLQRSRPASMLGLAYRAADALTWTGSRDPNGSDPEPD